MFIKNYDFLYFIFLFQSYFQYIEIKLKNFYPKNVHLL